MRIGIISEGHSDRAVIENIIVGITGLDPSNIVPIRPEYSLDATDMANIDPNTFSNWTLVKKECQDREKIDIFFSIEDQDFIVIHLDTAECEGYFATESPEITAAQRPAKDNNYCVNLRKLVVDEIDTWLGNNDIDKILHAVPVEEMDAWLLAIYDGRNDSSNSPNPKRRLQYILSHQELDSSVNYDNYLALSKPLSKVKKINRGGYLNNNCSLKLFYEEVKLKVKI